jgi:hypothetical protein
VNSFLTWDGTASAYGMMTADNVNIRADPVLDGAIIGTANTGDAALIWCQYAEPQPQAPADAWYLVLVNGVTGWISQSYVALDV